MLRLVKPSRKYLKSFLRVIDDYKSDENHFGRGGIDPLIKAIEENTVDEYLQNLVDGEKGKNLKPGYVPGTRYWLLDGNEFVGSFSIRHCLTPNLEQNGGHIAANIAPKYRGKYSSFVGIKMCLEKAKKLGLDKVLITCDVNNMPSYRAITGLLKIYGGEQISDSRGDGYHQHRVWINTTKGQQMQKWEKALDKFLKQYINKPWFEGAVLCGSYASGNQNKFSDIDVTIVASNDIGWQEKANCYVDGFLFEYIIQPIYKYHEYMKSGYENNAMLNQNMFAHGKVLYDKHGEVEKLRQQSVRDLKKKFKPKSKYDNDFMKYHLWDMYDELKSLKHNGYHTDLMYWTLVSYLITAYADFNCLWRLPKSKIEKILTNKEYAKRYHADKLPDKKFTSLLMACFNAKQKDKMSAIDKLYNFVMKSGGGFDIGSFRGKMKVEKR